MKPDPADPEIQWPAEYIDEVVRYVTANFRVDLNRIYVTGISRGGTGAWTYASAYPEKVAALLPLSGRSDLTQACPIKDIPIWAFHGDADGVAPTQYSIDMINAVKACQPPGIYKPRLNILHARTHNGWSEVYNGTNGYRVFDWLLMFKKNDVSNKMPYVNAGMDQRIALRSQPLHIIGDFFDSDGDIITVQWKQTGGTILTLNNTDSEFLKLSDLKTGSFEFELTVTDNKGARNSDRVLLEIVSASATPAITGLILINGKTNTEIGNLSEGQIINKSALGINEINIKAIASDGTASVRFSVNTDQHTRTLNSPGPYLIKNQTTGTEWKIENGEYLICATPFTQTGARGNRGISQCFKVTVTDGIGGESCPGTGKIEREVWTGITGTFVSSIPVNSPPSSKSELTIFEGPVNVANDYGARVRGYICPPVTGNYTFWISSDDKSELWLSTDDNPNNKVKVAYVSGATGSRQWDKFVTQKSAAISLVAGRKYYVEALHKEGTGYDNLAVGWQLPQGSFERPIPGERLMLYQPSGNTVPVVNITSPENDQQFTAPASISFTATASDSDGNVTKVEFYNGITKLGEDATSPYAFTWNNVSAGNYTLKAKAIDNNGASNTSSVDIVVTSGQACAGAGKIEREVWTGITGMNVSTIPVNSPPSSVSELTIFESPINVGDNYGSRIQGYICVPATGDYTFWIASDDYSELWLSSDENPANKIKIASVTGATRSREWTKYASQQSVAISLQGGRRYYIEALHKENKGGDNLAVGWQLPDGTQERPIPGTRLIPFQASGNNNPVVSITSPEDGQSFSAPASVNISATASDADGNVAKVEFYNGTTKLGEDATAPYVYTWNNVSVGNYTLMAKAIDNVGGFASATVRISVTSGSSCAGTGKILRELWTGIQYGDVASIPVNSQPDATSELTIFENPSNVGDNYGTRVSGYICAPATGAYTFWISSNDHSELWLSTDADRANKRKIAFVTGYTNVREWTKFSSQRSTINLTADQRYYIEALHKEGVGSDHMAVGWQLPNGTLERPIPGNRLSPFEIFSALGRENDNLSNHDNIITSLTSESKPEISLYPNPAQQGSFTLTVSGYDGIEERNEANVEIVDMTGQIIYFHKIICEINCNKILIDIGKEFTSGVYMVNATINRKRFSKRLVVR